MTKRLLARLFLSAFLTMTAATALAGEYFEKDGVALRGYDPVAYFTDGKPTKGTSAHAYEYKGSKFYFATAANQRQFARDPAKYAPQFGGFCALGTANGYKVSTQPDAFAVVDGKLYLNHDLKVLGLWQADAPGYITKAQEKWPEVSKSTLRE
ncbi:MAG TPA: YHS domain-containing (seleno)protein [Steroidobacteraceae bacterium]